MNSKRTLFIIEELGDITTSGAIVNYNLAKLLAKEHQKSSILTLDNVSTRIKKDWKNHGDFFYHPKDNLKKYQKFLMRFYKLRAIIFMLIGNDFNHYNRVKNIRNFLKSNIDDFDNIFLMSAGFGFTPHNAINKIKTKKKNIIALYHDPYPASLYPEPYRVDKNKFKDYFKIKNLQKSFNIVNHIIFPSQRLLEWYKNDYIIDANKVKIIPHCVANNGLKKANSINEIKKIIHTGTLLPQRNPMNFLEEFKKTKFKNYTLDFYGNINNQLFKKIQKYNKEPNININKERVSYKESINLIQNSDFLLLIESNGKHNPFLPTKFVDYLNAEKPIIILSPKNSEVSRLVCKNYPFISTLNDKTKINHILGYQINNREAVQTSISILKKIKESFSYQSILASYKEII